MLPHRCVAENPSELAAEIRHCSSSLPVKSVKVYIYLVSLTRSTITKTGKQRTRIRNKRTSKWHSMTIWPGTPRVFAPYPIIFTPIHTMACSSFPRVPSPAPRSATAFPCEKGRQCSAMAAHMPRQLGQLSSHDRAWNLQLSIHERFGRWRRPKQRPHLNLVSVSAISSGCHTIVIWDIVPHHRRRPIMLQPPGLGMQTNIKCWALSTTWSWVSILIFRVGMAK